MSALLRIGIALAAGLALGLGIHPHASRDVLEFSSRWTGQVRFLAPLAFYLVALLPLVPLIRSFGVIGRNPIVAITSVALRILLFLCLVVAAAEPSRIRDHDARSVVFAIDVSSSTNGARDAMQRYLERAVAARGDAVVVPVRFAREPRSVGGGTTDPAAWVRDAEGDGADETDLARAIGYARAFVAPGTLGRIVVLSDGIETTGDAAFAASRSRELGVPVDAVVFDAGSPDDVAIRGMTLPSPIEVGAPFDVAVSLHATRARRVRLELRQGLHPNALEPTQEVDLPAGDSEVRFGSVVRTPGPIEYRVELGRDPRDAIPGNDRMSAVANVPGRPVVLLAEGVRGREVHLARALTAAEFEVEVRTPRALPTRREEYGRFAFTILSDASADEIGRAQMDALEAWVRLDGGAVLAAGGDRSFGLGGWQGTPLERLMPVRMDPERRRDQPAIALALVLDRSGSMQGAKLELAKEAARAAAGLLGSDDAIEVIGFDASPERIVRMQSAGNRLAILRDIGRLAGSGGTMIFPAIDLAYQDLSATRAVLRHAILLTDGQSPEEGILELAQLMRADGITISTVGLGADVNRTLLARIAELGGGRSYFTNDPTQVPRIFLRETSTVTQSGVVEEPFVPRVVRSAEFLRGIDVADAPQLYGYVATRMKPSPAELLLASPQGEPILARIRVGEGWSLAWTSDVKSRWAADWVAWPGFSRFFAQLIREHLHRDDSRVLPMTSSLEGERVRIVIDALDLDDSFLEGLHSTVRLTRPDGTEVASARAVATAPGRYETTLPAPGYGSFLIEADHRREGRAFAESHGSLVRAYPGEFARTEADPESLTRVARAGGGEILDADSPEAPFRADQRTIRDERAAYQVPLFAALVVLLLDVAVRRLSRERERTARP